MALVEGGKLVEYYVQRAERMSLTGNIYKGRVTRVLPGMQAAFVDIGLERSAFLHASDIVPIADFDLDTLERVAQDKEGEGEEESAAIASLPAVSAAKLSVQAISSPGMSVPQPSEIPITDIIRAGEELIVQVKKEPIGSKGARLTSHIALAGRYLVFMPTVNNIGISHRIISEAERKRLKDIVSELRPAGKGFIIRTAAEGQDRGAIEEDMQFLVNRYERILKKAERGKSPQLLDEELDLILRSVRDLPSLSTTEIIVDEPYEYRRIEEFIKEYMPKHSIMLSLYENPEPLFDAFGIEYEVGQALQRKVWLKSGGYIVIDRTEALTAIDVNTGRYVGGRNLEETITQINLEAATEIAYQLRLRNIGGIIIIDFIDMVKEENRQKVLRALRESLQPDRARSIIYNISPIGLVEMTRKRVRESLSRVLTETCPYCRGDGQVKTIEAVINEIILEIHRQSVKKDGDLFVITASPETVSAFYDEASGIIERLEEQFGRKIMVNSVEGLHREQFFIDLVFEESMEKNTTQPG
ncbi:MAG: ribonuclease G [Myxococcota bacterium]